MIAENASESVVFLEWIEPAAHQREGGSNKISEKNADAVLRRSMSLNSASADEQIASFCPKHDAIKYHGFLFAADPHCRVFAATGVLSYMAGSMSSQDCEAFIYVVIITREYARIAEPLLETAPCGVAPNGFFCKIEERT